MSVPKRKAISTRRRFEIFKRDAFTCQYCGAHPPHVVLHVDHVVAVAEGGTNDDENLITACDTCNLGKSDIPLTSIPGSLSLAEKTASLKEREAQIRGYSEVAAASRARIEEEAWVVSEQFIEHFQTGAIRKDWLQSIKQFVELIGFHETIRAMEIALARKPFAERTCFLYFCGICWNIAKGGQR